MSTKKIILVGGPADGDRILLDAVDANEAEGIHPRSAPDHFYLHHRLGGSIGDLDLWVHESLCPSAAFALLINNYRPGP